MKKSYDSKFKSRVVLEALRGEQTMAELAAALASQIMKTRNENAILQEQKLFLLFNGRYFLSSDGKLLLDAVSGKPTEEKSTIDTATVYGFVAETMTRKFEYSVKQQGEKDTGGIPIGLYYILAKEERSALTIPYSHIVKPAGWGNYSWTLHPDKDTDIRQRRGFFIHGGSDFGSAGCIDFHKTVINLCLCQLQRRKC